MKSYEVLWIDDQINDQDEKVREFMDGFRIRAHQHGINLTCFETWEEAKSEISKNYTRYDAIILDYFCKKSKEDKRADEYFIRDVLHELAIITRDLLPWYILSAGANDEFRKSIVQAVTAAREKWDKAWVKIYYGKTETTDGVADVVHLFNNIKACAANRPRNIVQGLYRDVFDNIHKYFNKEVKDRLLNVLVPLHFPEENPNFEPALYYNEIRKTIESIFRSCNKYGLVPDECVPKGEVNLTDCCCYINGRTANHAGVRHKNGGVLPELLGDMLHKMLNVTNEGSHTSDKAELTEEEIKSLDDYFNQIGARNLLFSFALQLCDIIVYLKHRMQGSNREVNLQDCEYLEVQTPIEDYEGQVFVLEKDEAGNLFCGECGVSYKHDNKLGQKVRLRFVEPNSNEEFKEKYPYFAKKVELTK